MKWCFKSYGLLVCGFLIIVFNPISFWHLSAIIGVLLMGFSAYYIPINKDEI